jgi:hypothetical protein
LKENRETFTRIVEYAFARWFYEGTSTDLSRRESGFGTKSTRGENLKATLEIVAPAIDLVVRGDWRGFDRKSKNLDQLIGIPDPNILSWRLINEYLRFLQWCVGGIHGPNSQRIDISLRNARTQIMDSIEILRANRGTSFSENEEMITKLAKHITDYSSSRETLLSLDGEFYTILDLAIFENLVDLSFDILKEMPFKLNRRAPPQLKGKLSNIDQVAWLLVAAAERGLLDMKTILSTVLSWCIHPKSIVCALGPLGAKILLEEDVGFSFEQLITIIVTLRAIIDNEDQADPIRVYERFTTLPSELSGKGLQFGLSFIGGSYPVRFKKEPSSSVEVFFKIFSEKDDTRLS